MSKWRNASKTLGTTDIYIPLTGRAMQCHILTEPFNLFQKNLKSPNSDHIRNIFVKTWSWWDGSYCLGSAKQILQVKVKTFICGICGIICHIHYNFGGIEQSKLQQSFVLNAKIFRIDVYLVYSTRITMRTFSSSSGKCVYKRLPSITKTYFYWRLWWLGTICSKTKVCYLWICYFQQDFRNARELINKRK